MRDLAAQRQFLRNRWAGDESDAEGQSRPLADWTDCFQSGPATKGPGATPTHLRKLNYIFY